MSPQYLSFDPETELNGNTALAFLTNIQHHDIAAILERYEMAHIDPHAWYPLQRVLDVLSAIAEGGNASTNFVSIGVAAAQLGIEQLPPPIKQGTLEQLLMAYPAVYQQRHRIGDAGEVVVNKLNDDHFVVTLRVPYPDDVFYGILYGYTRYFCPPSRRFSVRYDTTMPRREEGGSQTVVHIQLT